MGGTRPNDGLFCGQSLLQDDAISGVNAHRPLGLLGNNIISFPWTGVSLFCRVCENSYPIKDCPVRTTQILP